LSAGEFINRQAGAIDLVSRRYPQVLSGALRNSTCNEIDAPKIFVSGDSFMTVPTFDTSERNAGDALGKQKQRQGEAAPNFDF
jgi:hypothetical protein